MIYKFLIPSNYFLYSNMTLGNGINNYLNKAPVFTPNDMENIRDIFRVIKLLNPNEWEKFIDPDLAEEDILDLSLEYMKKYPYNDKLINWSFREPRSSNNSFLIFLIYMMRKDKATILADVSYKNDVLSMELKPINQRRII